MANTITIAGHLIRNVEMRGEKKTIFSTAICDAKKNEEDLIFNLSFFGEHWTNVMSYLKKGSHLLVTGRLLKRQYVDKNGQTQLALDVVASSIDFINTGFSKEAKSGAKKASEEDENMPF